ncbi:caspase family protein [Nocardia brasiliensis]|uniref:caspase family protein n=1 Tax=Nocardia brasiliensis TaxID=37326 RepID=UPI0024584E6F|nr:caspase family protein [Nocardia brasiliensis]
MELPNPIKSRAVLIGVGDYVHLTPLPATIENVNALAGCLRDRALWGLPDGNCVVIRNPRAQETILDAVHEAADEATDSLIFYFAGHGLIDPDSGELLLGLTGSVQGRAYRAMQYEHVRRALRYAKARRRIVILDCCYSGKAVTGMSDSASVVADEVSAEGTFVLASAPENKQALSPDGEKYTAFTGELINLLNNGLQDGSEFISLQTLYSQTTRCLIARSRPRPQMRTNNTMAYLPLVLNRKGRAEPSTISSRSAKGAQLDDNFGNGDSSDSARGAEYKTRTGYSGASKQYALPADIDPNSVESIRRYGWIRRLPTESVLGLIKLDDGSGSEYTGDIAYELSEKLPWMAVKARVSYIGAMSRRWGTQRAIDIRSARK